MGDGGGVDWQRPPAQGEVGLGGRFWEWASESEVAHGKLCSWTSVAKLKLAKFGCVGWDASDDCHANGELAC